MPVGHLHFLFVKMSVQVFCPFFNQGFFFYVELYELFLYIGYESLISHIICKYLLPYSVGCLFILSMVSFAVQKLLSLVRSHLFIFAFSCFRRWIQNYIATIFVKECSLFSSRSFMVSSLTFRSLIHFEFIFVYGVRECSNFISLHVAVQFSQHHLLKRLSFLHCTFLPPLSQIN